MGQRQLFKEIPIIWIKVYRLLFTAINVGVVTLLLVIFGGKGWVNMPVFLDEVSERAPKIKRPAIPWLHNSAAKWLN
nr:hypothetical protein [Hafnia alvei]